MKKILVIEDDKKHMAEANAFLEEQVGVEVIMASDYSGAKDFMYKIKYDRGKRQLVMTAKEDLAGVISDIYFPLMSKGRSDQPEPLGVRVAVELSQLEVPFVLCTAGYHHGAKYEWINSMAKIQKWDLVSSASDHDLEAETKRWDKAYEILAKKMER